MLQRKKQMEIIKAKQYVSQQYNKALFTLSYLVSLQLRKYMELFHSITTMRPEDLNDPNIIKAKQEQIN